MKPSIIDSSAAVARFATFYVSGIAAMGVII